MNKSATLGFAFIFALSLTACSSRPTLVEQLMQQSNSAAHLAKPWEQGRDALASGEKLRKQGKAQIEEAHDAM